MDYRRTRILRGTTELVASLVILAAVTYFLREPLYRAFSGWTAESGFRSSVASLITDPGLVLLVLITAVLAVWAWLRDRVAFVRLACAGVGVIVAYLTSEAVKRIVQQERPCNTYEVVTALACREPGNFSWPSNHTVIAASFAAACMVALPEAKKLAVLVMALAGMVGLSRVAVGMHYFHDVFAGMALGITVVTVVSVVSIPFVMAKTENWTWLRGSPGGREKARGVAGGEASTGREVRSATQTQGQAPGSSAPAPTPEPAGDLLNQGAVRAPGRGKGTAARGERS